MRPHYGGITSNSYRMKNVQSCSINWAALSLEIGFHSMRPDVDVVGGNVVSGGVRVESRMIMSLIVDYLHPSELWSAPE
jgi:hypothetical protein